MLVEKFVDSYFFQTESSSKHNRKPLKHQEKTYKFLIFEFKTILHNRNYFICCKFKQIFLNATERY